MYIHEAVEKAVKENGKIIRSSARRPESDIYSEITPTNSYDACLMENREKQQGDGIRQRMI